MCINKEYIYLVTNRNMLQELMIYIFISGFIIIPAIFFNNDLMWKTVENNRDIYIYDVLQNNTMNSYLMYSKITDKDGNINYFRNERFKSIVGDDVTPGIFDSPIYTDKYHSFIVFKKNYQWYEKTLYIWIEKNNITPAIDWKMLVFWELNTTVYPYVNSWVEKKIKFNELSARFIDNWKIFIDLNQWNWPLELVLLFNFVDKRNTY